MVRLFGNILLSGDEINVQRCSNNGNGWPGAGMAGWNSPASNLLFPPEDGLGMIRVRTGRMGDAE